MIPDRVFITGTTGSEELAGDRADEVDRRGPGRVVELAVREQPAEVGVRVGGVGREEHDARSGEDRVGRKHWHGATSAEGMSHIAIQEHVGGKVVDWMEHVSEEQYGR